MFRLEEMCPNASSPPTALLTNFTNRFDAFYLLGKVFWCGCEFIAFATYNIFTDIESIFPTFNAMRKLPYYIDKNGMEEDYQRWHCPSFALVLS
ncbi:Auxin-induced protein 5NG4 [Hordeum vulgare]|nr:Auxin-induced protein 5NG4 [Hordeum vulgare]